jgi:fibronectin type 3 domain-containing protein
MNSLTALTQRILLLLIPVMFCCVSSVFSQGADPIIRTAVQQNQVYVYHTLRVPIGHGFNVYRSASGSDFEKLNNEPVQAAQNVAEFLGEIGELAEPLQQAMEVDNPQSLYLRLRSSRMAANLASFYYPDVARAMGHLYVDSTATIGSTATYRIELVDDQGTPTGEEIEQTVNLRKVQAPKPSELTAEHDKRQVTLTWQYPTTEIENDDKIVRFNVYDQQGDKHRKINNNPIVRINNFNEFEQIFTVPRTGYTLNLVVMPVDLTTQEGPPSEVLKYTVTDETPPAIISGLQAISNDNGEIELTWPVSTEADAAGYNLFRSRRIKGDYRKLNDSPIALLETFYVDRPGELRTTYFYRISAIDLSGNESKRSNAAKADLEDHVAPEPPLSFSAEPLEDGTVKLSWEEGERGNDFKSYILLRKELARRAGAADVQLTEDNLTATSFIDKGEADLNLADGARYRYQIFVADSARNFSDTLTAIVKIPDVTPPESPTRLTVENDNGVRAVLRWNASVSTDLGQYLVFRGTSRDSLEVYQQLPVSQRRLRDDSVNVGKTYFYAVGAVDTLGNEGPTTDVSSFLMKDFTPPRAVRNVQATLQNDQVNIRWERVTSSDFRGYRVYTSSSPSGVYEPITDQLLTETQFSTADLDASSWIQVRAVDTSGNESKPSKPARVYIPNDDN